MTEKGGIFTVNCPSIEVALPLIKEVFDEDYSEHWDEEDRPTITFNDLIEKVLYECKKCGFYTIGEAICLECEADLKGKGRKTFVWEINV
jgi:hypothetical protein